MDKTILKNGWALAGLLLVISIFLGLVILAVVKFFKIGNPSISGAVGIIGAMIVGQVYTFNFKEIMPKKLRVHVTLIYILTQVVLGSVYLVVFNVPDYQLFFGLLIGGSLLYSLLIYLLLGYGGKTYLKTLQKREAK